MNVLSPRQHGLVDYAACAAMLAAPTLLNLNGAARTASYAFAGSYLLVSALTDYPVALRRVLPFPMHGKIELASAPALLAVPALLGALKDNRARAYFVGLTGMVLGTYALTDWDADPDE
ncbi:hypothetical protein [Deinococcus maricopensis]|uniref:Uncharacterized protein n=1 Tax=Deinococcus maricopensis (strain DSM 21211 / LMG 22137 / NRRL B-23946 / LB-34) TaxID=709986 RepID=E8U841_DEIML|nr:hypothetical protein [Deinococcus maricopensis]ADV67230.1 hypothetical protein Deima_1581 [Deinococcus maricopensis DSM 21211]